MMNGFINKREQFFVHSSSGNSRMKTFASPEDKQTDFPGPLMSENMQKEKLRKFIKWKAKDCLEKRKVEEYFFWLIMELFCHQNGDVLMFEVTVPLFSGFSSLKNKLGLDIMTLKQWCLSLARLLCSDMPHNEQVEAVVRMGDRLASKNQIFAAHICYVVAKVELGSRSQFELIGCRSVPFGTNILPDAIERTETYEYMLALTSGRAQPSFQIFKLCHANRLASFSSHKDAFNYCEAISRAVITIPDQITRSLIGRLISLTCKVQKFIKDNKSKWLPELTKLHRTKLAEANHCQDVFSDIKHSVPIPSLQSTNWKQSKTKRQFKSLYMKEGLLGKGGFGSVYSGFRIADMKKVAIKYVNKDRGFKTIMISGQKLPLEVALMKMVSEPPCSNVIQLLDWFDKGDVIIMVLEQPSSCMDLWNFIRSTKKNYLSELETRVIMVQVIRAARHCFDCGVLHRDIKPQNILINPNTMKIKLIDFGCGALMQDEPFTKYSGTVSYAPPEYALDGKYMGVSTTVWGLGILMIRLLSGKDAFKSMVDLKERELALSDHLSRECFELIMWCLELNPESRPTFDDLARHEWFTENKLTAVLD